MKINATILKTLLIALVAVFSIQDTLLAQTQGGPDAYGYIWRDSNDPNGPTFNWIDVPNLTGAVQVSGLGDDNIRGPFTIGFPFHYYWYDVSTFYVGSNGYMGFTSTPVSHPFPPIPTPAFIQNYLAGMATDLTFTDAAQQTIGTAAAWYWTNNTDTLILSYENVPFWAQASPGYSGDNTFQIILSGVDSSITYQYLIQTGASQSTVDFVTVGIENVSGIIGLEWGHNIYPPSVYSIKFYYPSNTTFQVNDASTVYNNNPETGGLFLSANGGDFVMNTRIANTGNQSLSPFNVLSRVVNLFNQPQVSATVQSSALTPGQTEDLTFSASPYQPGLAGTYRYVNDTQLPGDATPTNNQKTMELQVVDTTQASILLAFDNGVDAGAGGLGWSGGGGGVGIEFIPPFYPCNLTEVRAYITGNTNFVGFAMVVVDDDGPNGTPGTVLDSVFVSGPSVLTGAWNNALLTAPLQIDSGSVYIAWMMGGDGISIGQNQLPPFSNRSYEILGKASNPNAWSPYRYREIEDVMINAYISKLPVGINEPAVYGSIGNVYPNPVNSIAHINYSFSNFPGEMVLRIMDLNGKVLSAKRLLDQPSEGIISILTDDFVQGIYLVELQAGNERFNRKMTVIR